MPSPSSSSSPLPTKCYADSLRYSIRGLVWSLMTERNSLMFLIQMTVGEVICRLFAAPAWCYATVGIIGWGAISAELANTAIERTVDKFGHGEIDEESRLIKDAAAGAVMPWGIAFVSIMAYVVVTSPVLAGRVSSVSRMLVTLLPIMLGGMTSMLVLKKTRLLSFLARPVDNGHTCRNGRHLLGENKTWRGFATMALSCAFWQVAVNWLLRLDGFAQLSHLAPCVPHGTPPVLFDVMVGAAIGIMYMLCELPNSWAKRRLGIGAGGSSEAGSARTRMLLFGADHLDSSIGCCALICAVAGLGLGDYVLYLLVSFAVHVLANVILRATKVRSSM